MSQKQDVGNTKGLPPHLQLMELANGYWKTQSIYVAAKLGIADIIGKEPKSVEEIAEKTKAHTRSLYRLLRALASIGIFFETDDGRFAPTPLSDALQSDNPISVRPMLLTICAKFIWDSWSNLLHSVMTGECAFEHVHGMPFFEYGQKNPYDFNLFNDWMARLGQMQSPLLAHLYDFSSFNTIVDIGGRRGIFISNILKENSHLKGILYDLPEVVRQTPDIDVAEVGDRCQIIGGDFFKSIPEGVDLYILKAILHDWNDDLSIKILKNCSRAMTTESRLLVIESVVPTGNQSHHSKFLDLNMLVLNHGGQERTETEFKSLFNRSGFQLTNIISTPLPFSFIEGMPKK